MLMFTQTLQLCLNQCADPNTLRTSVLCSCYLTMRFYCHFHELSHVAVQVCHLYNLLSFHLCHVFEHLQVWILFKCGLFLDCDEEKVHGSERLYQLMYHWGSLPGGQPFFNSTHLPRTIPNYKQFSLQSEINSFLLKMKTSSFCELVSTARFRPLGLYIKFVQKKNSDLWLFFNQDH
jgi:hypothetical protein